MLNNIRMESKVEKKLQMITNFDVEFHTCAI